MDADFWTQQRVHFEHIALIANAILAAKIAKAPEVMGNPGEEWCVGGWRRLGDNKLTSTHRARLVAIEEMK